MVIPKSELKPLDDLAPSYLQGPRAATRRVQWAILELVRLKAEERERKEAGNGEAR